MKYNYSKEKAKEVLKKYAEGGKVNAGTYRVGNPIKVGNMYEQKVAIISSNGDIRSNSEFGMTKTDFISMKYPKISEKKFYSLSNYAEGGSLGNHGLKHGDQIIKTMSGGVQKIKTKTGDIVYVNLANGYRGAEPPLPFETGGGVGESKFEIKFNKDDKNEGEIITPYKYKIIGYSDSFELKVRFEELYKGTYSFNEYNICQFIIESRDINSAIKLAIERLKYIFKDGVAKRNSNKIFVVSGFQFDEKNTKKPYTPSFMENTHSMNQFTENSFKTKKGDLLKYDSDGDGYGFWYLVNKDGERISNRLKGSIFVGYISDGVIFEKNDNYANGGVTKNYINRNQLNTITIKKGDQKLTYKVSDVYNGAYKLEDGGNLQKTAFYVPKRNVVKVQLRDGKDVKVANGYWIKKGAKPIHTSKYDDGGFMADVYANGGVIGKEMTFYRHGEEEKGIIGELNEDGSYNVSTKYSIILVEPQDVISIKDSTKKKGFFFEGGGKTTFKQKATAIAKNFEGKKVEPKYQKEYGKTYNKAEAKEVGNKIAGSQKAKYDSKMSGGGQIKVGDFLTLKRDVLIAYDHSEKSEKIHKGDKLEVVSISPNNPEFLRLKKENVSNNIGLRVSDFEKYELGGKTTSGGTTKRGGSMQLAKQIRKEGESWGSAIKRANEQIRNK